MLSTFSSGEESDDQAGSGIQINKDYARRFTALNRKKDLDRAHYQGLDDSSSDSESEDEQGHALTPQLDFQILRTIEMIKSKDSRIYQKDVEWYDEKDGGKESGLRKKQKESKPMKIKDYIRERVLEKMESGTIDGHLSDEEEGPRGSGASYRENQDAAKAAFLSAAADDGSADDSDGELFSSRVKSDAPESDDEAARVQREAMEALPEADKQTMARFFREAPTDENEKFLREYVLKRQWRDEPYVDLSSAAIEAADDADAEDLDAADQFEAKHNFRFEEEGGTSLQSYARNVEGSLRRPKDKRKRARAERAARKAAEKSRKREELKRLKNLKKQALMDKLKQIAAAGGIGGDGDGESDPEKGGEDEEVDMSALAELGLTEADLEADFDPEAFDKRMNDMYNDEYYGAEDPDADGLQPANIIEHASADEGGDGAEGGSSGEGEAKQAAAEQEADGDAAAPKLSRAQRRRQARKERMARLAAEAAEEYGANQDEEWEEGEGEELDPEQAAAVRRRVRSAQAKVAKEHLDDLYGMDYEDIVGGVRTRFKYRSVPAADYGLSAEEILAADDSQLAQLVSLKRMSAYREQEWTVNTKQRQRFRHQLRASLEEKEKKKKATEVKQEEEAVEALDATLGLDEASASAPTADVDQPSSSAGGKKKRKRRRKKKGLEAEPSGEMESTADPPSTKRRRADISEPTSQSTVTGVQDNAEKSEKVLRKREKRRAAKKARRAAAAKSKAVEKKKGKKKKGAMSDSRLASYGLA